jgi:hypothetical protein
MRPSRRLDSGRSVQVTLAAPALLLALAACESGEATAGGFTVRDSAGVQIVESFTSEWSADDGWGVGEAPMVHIGVIDGAREYQFSTIAGLWRDDDDHILVADARSAEIRAYDADGAFLRSFGRQGNGPGELQRIVAAAPYQGDSIFATVSTRIVIFDREGVPGRTTTLAFPQEEPRGTGSMTLMLAGGVLGPFADGSFLASSGVPARGNPGDLVTMEQILRLLSREGDPIGVIKTQEGGPITFPDPGSPQSTPEPSTPFTPATIRTIDGNRIYLGSGPRFEIGHYDQEGNLLRSIRASHLDLRVTEAAREAYREWQRTRLPDGPSPQFESMLSDVEFPDSIPAFSSVLVDSEDHLWVRHYQLPASQGPEEWSVFAPDGHLLGVVTTPERLQTRQIGSDFILGIWTDDFDVRHVRMYSLDRE